MFRASSLPDNPSEAHPPGQQPALVSVQGVHKTFRSAGHQVHVLKGIDMELRTGELVMLKGRSGSGKTTLMNLIGGLDTPSEGRIIVGGRPLHSLGDKQRTRIRKHEIGFIFQAYALHPLLSAWENVELSLRMAGIPSGQWTSRIGYCLEQVGMAQRAHHRPYELSGGEQQRVAIAKAIASRPKLLLADEPTAELDSKMAARVLRLFQTIREDEAMTICMTTHDRAMLEVADHVYEMADGKLQ